MKRTHTSTKPFGPFVHSDAARVMVRISYLLGRRAQAPIRPREADT